MPQIPTILATEDPRARPPETRANPDAFGANIGAAVQQLGGAVGSFGGALAGIGEKQDEEARRLRLAEAVANADYTPREVSLFQNAPVGGQGYATSVVEDHAAWVDEKVAEYQKRYPEDRKGADMFRINLLGDRQRISGNAARNEAEMAAQSSTLSSQSGLSVQLNSIRADMTNYEAAKAKGIELLSAQPGYTETAKAAGIATFKSQAAVAFFDAQLVAAETQPDPAAAMQGILAELNKPQWQNEFTAEHYETVRNAIETNIGKVGTALKSLVTAEVTDYAARLKAYDVNGPAGQLINPEDLEGLYRRVAKYAPEKADEVRQLMYTNQTYHESRGLNSAALDERRKSVSAAGGTYANVPGKSNIVYANSGTRNRPVSDNLAGLYRQAADAAGIDSVRVVSGGQPAAGEGGARTGSTRHDHGNAGDIQLIKDGRALDMTNPADMPAIKAFIAKASQLGATGIGAGTSYMGSKTFHVGYGSRAIWGAGGKGANAPAWLVETVTGNPPGPGVGAGGGGMSMLPEAQRGTVARVSNLYGVPANVLAGMWRQESGGKVEGVGVSSAGAKGPFQFTDATWADYGKGGDVNDFDQAADAAARYMSDLMKQFGGDPELALMAYNWGPGSVRTWMKEGRNPADVPLETREYVQKVMGYAQGGGADTPTGGSIGGYMSPQDFQRYQDLSTIMSQQDKAISANMMDFSMGSPVPTMDAPSPLDMANPDAGAFAQRGSDVLGIAAYHNVGNDQWKVFTSQEENIAKQIMAEGDAAQQVALLRAIAGMSQPVSDAALKQLGQSDPVFAMAGRVNNDATAVGILQGRKELKSKDGSAPGWSSSAKTAWGENRAAYAAVNPEDLGAAEGAVEALYAYKSRYMPATEEVDPDLYREAVEEVFGMQTDEVNGAVTFIPQTEGLDGPTVEAAMSNMTIPEWQEMSVDNLPPVGINSNGQVVPMQPWAMEGATLHLYDGDDQTYEVAVDGQRVAVVKDGGVQPFLFKMDAERMKALAVAPDPDYGVDEPVPAPSPEVLGAPAVGEGTVEYQPGVGFVVKPGVAPAAPEPAPAPVPPKSQTRSIRERNRDTRTKDDYVPPAPTPEPWKPTAESDARMKYEAAVKLYDVGRKAYEDALRQTGMEDEYIQQQLRKYDFRNKPERP